MTNQNKLAAADPQLIGRAFNRRNETLARKLFESVEIRPPQGPIPAEFGAAVECLRSREALCGQ
jgi:hypothetical protein